MYNRKKSWATAKLRWTVCGILFLSGLLCILSEKAKADKNFYLFAWCLLTPAIYNTLDRLFKFISEKKYNRDFYLWLRYSGEIDYTLFGKNPHVNWLDKFFSLILLFSIALLPLLGMR
ncbi:MAG TPA: hypothetical protein VIZ28_18365 [Chitinophagaceae bacterium]